MPEADAAPSQALLMLESRAIPELFSFALVWPALAAIAPRGDGQPVMVLPGLANDDSATTPLRGFLAALGYPTYGWDQGANLGPRPGVEAAMLRRLDKLAEQHGRTVSLVGWSLGGVYARQIAKIAPDRVRQVVTLGAPFNGDPRATNGWRLYELASGLRAEDQDAHIGGPLADPPPAPSTAIYSRSDGVCNWRTCLERIGEMAENIEVRASHCGLGHDPAAAYAIADRLAQKEGGWTPFDRGGFRAFVYPEPESA